MLTHAIRAIMSRVPPTVFWLMNPSPSAKNPIFPAKNWQIPVPILPLLEPQYSITRFSNITCPTHEATTIHIIFRYHI